MGRFILRRFIQAIFTIFGVMLVTFILFNVIAGDISYSFVGAKASREERRDFYEKHKLNLPKYINYHRRLELLDKTGGEELLSLKDTGGTNASAAFDMRLTAYPEDISRHRQRLLGRYIWNLNPATPVDALDEGDPETEEEKLRRSMDPRAKRRLPKAILKLPENSAWQFSLADGNKLTVKITGVKTAEELIQRVNSAPDNDGRLEARITEWSFPDLFNSQFFWHMWQTLTFQARSFGESERTLWEIIGEHAKYSLALTVPALALGWLFGMVISCVVAYYRDTWIDRSGVFFSVLGMCVPYLAYMLLGQWAMFSTYPRAAWGLHNPANIYVPVLIAVVAGLGGMVRFYRTIILDQVNRDYVRTARAKGVPLPGILFKHVLKNCMLPILTSLVSAIPFLIMGSLLLERFFGVPGLGGLMLSSITTRDVPIITGLTFFTALVYMIGLLVTDVLYAVFDPRIRLR